MRPPGDIHLAREHRTEAGAVRLRPAAVADVPAVHGLIRSFADEGLMLPRSRYSLYEHIRDYLVATEGTQVVACVALQVVWEDLAEIRSLAVVDSHQGRGIARTLVEAALADARNLGIRTVFVLTYVASFFARMGFRPADKSELPQKIWHECVHCTQFPDCGEEALILALEEERAEGYSDLRAPSV